MLRRPAGQGPGRGTPRQARDAAPSEQLVTGEALLDGRTGCEVLACRTPGPVQLACTLLQGSLPTCQVRLVHGQVKTHFNLLPAAAGATGQGGLSSSVSIGCHAVPTAGRQARWRCKGSCHRSDAQAASGAVHAPPTCPAGLCAQSTCHPGPAAARNGCRAGQERGRAVWVNGGRGEVGQRRRAAGWVVRLRCESQSTSAVDSRMIRLKPCARRQLVSLR